jgi:outer membrane protein TolC
MSMRRKAPVNQTIARAPGGRAFTLSVVALLSMIHAAYAQPAGILDGIRVETATSVAQPRRAPESARSPQAVAVGPRVLTLDDALALAEVQSQQVQIAQANVTRAESQQLRTRSEWLPQVFASASYDRALASEFQGIFDAAGPSCTPFTLNPQSPLAERVAEIERALRDCPPTGNVFGRTGTDDEGLDLPFGRANTYRLNLALAQNVYTGGRLTAQRTQAELGRANARLALGSTRAQLALDVAQAYFDALLSDRLVTIAEATLVQAESTAEQVRQQRAAGRVAEFDLVRAQVTRDNQRPEVIRQRNARDVAYLRLKQLLDFPLDTELRLVASLEDAVLPAPAVRFAGAIAAAEAGTMTDRVRAPIAQAENDVQQSEAAIRIARAQRLPSMSLSSSYGRVAYPSGFEGFGNWRTNWTVGIAAQVPLFTGGRFRADEMAARAALAETQARLHLTRELATLDEASARLELANARAAWEATAGTVQQARRAYEIADLRYREGLSTQLELSDARLLLQQAQANQARAARAVQIARVRLALLPELPLTSISVALPQQVQPATPPAPQPGAPVGIMETGVSSTGVTGSSPAGAAPGRGGAQ